ncbi:MAG: hypothetical protein JO041_14245 [Acidobacteria bacterium]|nr:hypothetical protein [Acidobacteriota bacterium]
MKRLLIAMSVYGMLALVAGMTLTATVEVDGRAVPIVWVVWAVLGMFAFRTWLHQQRERLAAVGESEHSN